MKWFPFHKDAKLNWFPKHFVARLGFACKTLIERFNKLYEDEKHIEEIKKLYKLINSSIKQLAKKSNKENENI